jgi:hypothetical protein
MPSGSSPKRERPDEHIKESCEDRAARAVNEQRVEHADTQSSTSKAKS